jgi:hypothetical protein
MIYLFLLLIINPCLYTKPSAKIIKLPKTKTATFPKKQKTLIKIRVASHQIRSTLNKIRPTSHQIGMAAHQISATPHQFTSILAVLRKFLSLRDN